MAATSRKVSPEGALPPPRSGAPDALDPRAVDAAVRAALDEDLVGPNASGDVTSESVLDDGRAARATLVSKAEGVIAGLDVFQRAFELVDPSVRVARFVRDGDRVVPGQRLALVEGRARAVLTAERTALNFLQRLSGTATATARLVARAAGRARVLDTRKTTPGLRVLEKYAVRCGGGENHRFGLFDEVLVKDNHLDLAGLPLDEIVRRARARVGPGVRVTVEARTEAEAKDAVRAGADVVLLDNFGTQELAALVPRLRDEARAAGRTVELEASGGIDERTLSAVADTGVDRISAGGMTHSAPSLDLSLVVERAG